MHTVTDFNRLMTEYAIDYQDKTVPGQSGLIQVPVENKFFTGVDGNGRVFVNLPIVLKQADGRKTTDTISVYQRYTNRDDVFVIGGGPTYLADISLFGPHFNNLNNLEKLLDGKVIRLFINGDNTQPAFTMWLNLPSLSQIIAHVFKSTLFWRTTPTG